jgi:hypothetical protein
VKWLTTIGNASMVAQTTLNNLSAAEADGGYAIGGMIPQTSTDTKILDWAKRVQDKYKVPADNFTVSYYGTVYMLKSIIEKVGCDKPAIRDALAATKDWKGMLIDYQADARGRPRTHAWHLPQQGQDTGARRADQGKRILNPSWASSSSTALHWGASTLSSP